MTSAWYLNCERMNELYLYFTSGQHLLGLGGINRAVTLVTYWTTTPNIEINYIQPSIIAIAMNWTSQDDVSPIEIFVLFGWQ